MTPVAVIHPVIKTSKYVYKFSYKMPPGHDVVLQRIVVVFNISIHTDHTFKTFQNTAIRGHKKDFSR